MHFVAVLVTLGTSVSLVDVTPAFGTGKDACGHKSFWWKEKGCCLPIPKPSSPPAGHTCMKKWYWSPENKCCVPEKPTTPEPSDGAGSCNKGDFWWDKKKCCLPQGGIPIPPSPPNGYQCPNKWTVYRDRFGVSGAASRRCLMCLPCRHAPPIAAGSPTCTTALPTRPLAHFHLLQNLPSRVRTLVQRPNSGGKLRSAACLSAGLIVPHHHRKALTALRTGTRTPLATAASPSPSHTTTSRHHALSPVPGSLNPFGASHSLLALRRAPTASSGGRIASAACLTAVQRTRGSHRLVRHAQVGGAGESRRSAAYPTRRLWGNLPAGLGNSGV
ncbi:unnamed protein product [Rhizoctonia solani]|uniref:CBM1 domain-containing protein n=1 Tax=Rhizoctonia solani TaxID=456999 RepID=A0A8H3GNR0_9AGAM|nr:unnamed protein product [Rhizoctonia solani]